MTVYTDHRHPEFNVTAIGAAAQTVITDMPGDVSAILSILYAVSESGGGVSAGSANCAPGGTVDLYDDGVDVLTLTVAANGGITVARSAGAETFELRLSMVWI